MQLPKEIPRSSLVGPARKSSNNVQALRAKTTVSRVGGVGAVVGASVVGVSVVGTAVVGAFVVGASVVGVPVAGGSQLQ